MKITKNDYVQEFLDNSDNDDLQIFLDQDLNESIEVERDVINEMGYIITDLTTIDDLVKVMKIKAMLVLEMKDSNK